MVKYMKKLFVVDWGMPPNVHKFPPREQSCGEAQFHAAKNFIYPCPKWEKTLASPGIVLWDRQENKWNTAIVTMVECFDLWLDICSYEITVMLSMSARSKNNPSLSETTEENLWFFPDGWAFMPKMFFCMTMIQLAPLSTFHYVILWIQIPLHITKDTLQAKSHS